MSAKSGRPKRVPVQMNDGSAPKDAPCSPLGKLPVLKADPWNRGEDLAVIFAPVINGEHPPDSKLAQVAGGVLMSLLHDAPADVVKEVFNRILAMKEAYDEPDQERPVHVRVLLAYGRFLRSYGSVPSKPVFKEYLIKEARVSGLPLMEDKKGWTRLWKSAGLQKLSDR